MINTQIAIPIRSPKNPPKFMIANHNIFLTDILSRGILEHGCTKYHIRENIFANNLPTPPNAGSISSMNKTVCFCGSFKFYNDMENAAKFLRQQGFKVIVPQPSHIRHGHKPEVLKSGKYDQKTLALWEGEGALAHLENIRTSDAVYIFNKGSYLGPAVTVEIGFSLALHKSIFARAPIQDITVTNFIKAVVSPKKLAQLLR